MVVVEAEQAQEQVGIVNRHDGEIDDAALLAEIGVSEGTAGFDEENKPSAGDPGVKEGIWGSQPTESPIANQAEVTITPEPEIKPIATGLSETPTMDSQYMARPTINEDGKAPTEPLSPSLEAPSSPAALNITPTEVPEVPAAFAESAIPAVTQAETQSVLHGELPADIAKTQAKFDKVLESHPVPAPAVETVPEVVDPQEAVDQIADPQERLEARTASVTEVLEKMRGDIQDFDEELDKRLAEAKAIFEERIATAESREKAANEQVKLAEAERIDANNEKIAAQNDFERYEGEISGRKNELATKLEEVESLQTLSA